MPKKRAKRTYDSHATRERILDVASDLFQRRGYHATSMHELMDAAGVPGGSMYHYFPTKKSLGLAVIGERVAAAVAQTWIEPVERAPDARSGILGVFEDVARGIERKAGRAIGCPVSNLAVELTLIDRDFQAALVRVLDAWGGAVRERLIRDARTRRDRDAAPAVATTIVAAFSGAMTLAKAAQTAQPIRDCARTIEALLKAG